MHAYNWHPVTWISHMLDVEIYGLEAGGTTAQTCCSIWQTWCCCIWF